MAIPDPATGVAGSSLTPPVAQEEALGTPQVTLPAADVAVSQLTPSAALDSDPTLPPHEEASEAVTPIPMRIEPTSALQASTASTQVVPASPVAIAREEFINKLMRHTSRLLLLLTISKRRKQSMPQVSTLHRSRRLAGAGVEFQMGEMSARSKKRAMRTLGIIGENGGIDQQSQDEYSELFSQPLTASHIEALAALFGCTIPDDLAYESDSAAVIGT
ncbi:hypothetical protein PR202_gb29327 [Eleusine coracana subsp. coracana]|uniref:Uncharacterized protein n=1 Tax=Eleusine coracana subsp. coracana TaxID=191504 RepID=A0AAV5FWY1_ELECO|nr:hypothetical protein PR202_gb29327 [Eleusine coracana subsp. coracana]